MRAAVAVRNQRRERVFENHPPDLPHPIGTDLEATALQVYEFRDAFLAKEIVAAPETLVETMSPV